MLCHSKVKIIDPRLIPGLIAATTAVGEWLRARSLNTDVYLTSTWRDWKQSPTFTLHGAGLAADFDVGLELKPEEWESLRLAVKYSCGPSYDVLAHDVGKGWHVHVEFDPKDDPDWLEEKEDLLERWIADRLSNVD